MITEEQVARHTTSDGKIFYDKADAVAHENKADFIAWYAKYYMTDYYDKVVDHDTVYRWLIDNANEITNLLIKIAREK